MPHQFGSGGSGVVESSSHKWRRKILKLTRQDYEYEQGILTPHKLDRSDYAIDNSVFSSRFHGNRKDEKNGCQGDNYDELDFREPIQTISRSSDGRFVLGDPKVKPDRTDYMTLDTRVYPTTNARASHIQGSQGNIGQVQDGRQQCHMRSSWDYVQFYHPQYYLTQDTKLDLPLQRMRYPDVHLAALEAPSHDHTVPTNDENGFYSLVDWASCSAGEQHGRRHCRRRDLQPSGGDYSRVWQPFNGRTLPWNKIPPSGHTENYTMYPHHHDQGIYSQIQEQGSNEQYKTHQRRSKSADSYYGNYANNPFPSRVSPRDPTISRSRSVTRDDGYVRISSRSAPTTPGYRSPSGDYPLDRRSDTTSAQYYRVTYDDRPDRHAHYHSTRSATPSTSHPDRSKRLSSGTPHSRATTETPGADYRSYLTSSPDVHDGSGQPFIISDVSSVLPGSSSLMTSSNQMPTSMVTSPSLQMTSTTDGGGDIDFRNQCHHHPESLSRTPNTRSSEVLHQRSLSDGDGAGWRDPQRYLFSGSAPLAEDRIEAGIYSPRTVEFMERYIADEDNKARGPPMRTRLSSDRPHSTAAATESSPEELANTREKLDQAVQHVRKGRLQPSYGHSAPELDVHEPTLHRPRAPHFRSSVDLIGSTQSDTDRSVHHNAANYKGDRSGYQTISAVPYSQRGGGSRFAKKTPRSHDVSLSPRDPLFEGQGRGQHCRGAPCRDSSQSTSGLGSKDTSRTLSSQGATTGSDDHMTSQLKMHSPHSSIPNHETGPSPIKPRSHPHLATQETSCDENYEFDSVVEAELAANLLESGVSPEGASVIISGSGLQSHSPSPDRIDPNESMEDKFERLRREYREYESSSQENPTTEVPPTHRPSASQSSLNELESETL